MFEIYEKGTRCWVDNPQGGWLGAVVESKQMLSPTECELQLVTEETGNVPSETRVIKITEDPAPEILLRNPAKLEDTHDLVTLSHQNEPSVLHSIQVRYENFQIYTYSGIVLIAINPFEQQDHLYTNEMVNQYNERREREELDPHVFRIARDAFTCMRRDQKNQTIVVSGESGAGKTVSAKYIMRYFATVENPLSSSSRMHVGTSASTVGSKMDDDSGLSPVEREILATNPIMEAFGNAKTTRNDNSSRFGKYLEIRFDDKCDISGARIRTYLLERSRIVYHPESERNYHIFYQMLSGLPQEDLEKLGLSEGVSFFNYVKNGDPKVAGIDDKQEFLKTCEALNTVGVTPSSQFAIFQILAGLLHLGNIELKPTSRSVFVASDDPAMVKCCELLGIDPVQLSKWLSKKQIQMRSETIVSDIDAKASNIVRDSIAKFLYSSLFDWLVSTVNKKLYVGDGSEKFIGVLDIYGFEHFKHNSFEQFCINYANEKLQQEFNQHVFKLEQEEYASEEIDWTYIDFVDNQPCIELIENKMGILGLLDEESRLPAGTDEGFTQKMYTSLEGNANFKKPRLGQSSFIVSHYAHEVEYETEGFIEKNRDTVPETIMTLLNESKNPFLASILELQNISREKQDEDKKEEDAKMDPVLRRRKINQRPTLGNIFKTSLIELMNTISSTNVHYIRCIKPNESKSPWVFDTTMVLNQLRACGVLETIRISSKGFPGRWLYEDFVNRFIILVHSSLRELEPKELSRKILENVCGEFQNKMSYELGKTKVFLGSGLLAQIENSRMKRQSEAAVTLQKHIKGRYQRNRYLSTLKFLRDIQNASRAALARLRYAKMVENAAIVDLQALIRRKTVRDETLSSLRSIISLQHLLKSNISQKRAVEQSKNLFATQLQALARRNIVNNRFKTNLRALCLVQSMARRRDAVKQLHELREKQQSVAHFTEEQYRMENKVVQLQNLLSQKREEHKNSLKELTDSKSTTKNLEDQMSSLKSRHHDEIKQLKYQITELVAKLESSQAEVELHKKNYQQIKTDVEAKLREITDLNAQATDRETAIQALTTEIETLRQANSDLQEEARRAMAKNIGASAVPSAFQRYAAADDLDPNEYEYETRDILIAEYMREYESSPEFTSVNDSTREMFCSHIDNVITEYTSSIIKNLEIPVPGSKEGVSKCDALFPGNLINLMLTEMWRLGLLAESRKFIGAILPCLQETIQKMNFNQLIYAAPFWISNMQEVYSLFHLVSGNIANDGIPLPMSPEDFAHYQKVIDYAKGDVTSIIFNLYYVYMQEVKKHLERMITHAVIEDQSIPGFRIEKNTTGVLKNFFSNSQNKPRMDNFIMDLNRIHSGLTAYMLEPSYVSQAIREIMDFIGDNSFNDFLMRKSFLSWKRGVQVNYNVTRLNEWCTGHGFSQEALSLEPIVQATKILQLMKSFDGDVGVFYDICWKLNPTQIHRIITNYQAEDFEQPIDKKSTEYIAKRIKENPQESTELVKPVRQSNDAGPFEIAPARILSRLEPYIPEKIEAPSIKKIISISTKTYFMQKEAFDQAELEADKRLAELNANGNAEGLHNLQHPQIAQSGSVGHVEGNFESHNGSTAESYSGTQSQSPSSQSNSSFA